MLANGKFIPSHKRTAHASFGKFYTIQFNQTLFTCDF
jgi:hypothetical protein